MHVSPSRHLLVISTARLTSSGFGLTEVIVTAASGDVSDLNFSEESVSPGVMNTSRETGVALATCTSAIDRGASTRTPSEAISSANCAFAAKGARRSTVGPASLLSIAKEPNTTIDARAKVGMASSRHDVAIASNRVFIGIVSHGTGCRSKHAMPPNSRYDDGDNNSGSA